MNEPTIKSTNTLWHQATINRLMREEKNRHKSVVLWFTGLSGSGKSTLAHAVEEKLFNNNVNTFVLDGDNVRHGLCGDLGFKDEDRKENIRRVGEVAKLMLEAGLITLTAFISPYKEDRNRVRNLMPHGEFFEIYCYCPLEVCEQRDVKGLYKKARQGEIKHFTGISSEYEIPVNPELIVDTNVLTLEESVTKVIDFLSFRNVVTNI